MGKGAGIPSESSLGTMKRDLIVTPRVLASVWEATASCRSKWCVNRVVAASGRRETWSRDTNRGPSLMV